MRPYDALAASLRTGTSLILGALRSAAEAKDLQQALFEDRISVIARAGHPLARTACIDFDALRQATWVLSRHGSPSRELLEGFFWRRTRRRRCRRSRPAISRCCVACCSNSVGHQRALP